MGGTFGPTGICSNPNGQIWDPYSGYYGNGVVAAPGVTYSGRVLQTPIPYNNMGTYTSVGNANLTGTGFQLPAVQGNLIDPVASKMMSYFPAPNVNVGSAAYNPYNNWIGSGVNVSAWNQFDIKIDQRFTDRTTFNARYSMAWGNNLPYNCYGNALDPCSSGLNIFANRSFALIMDHTFSPNTILNVSAGFMRTYDNVPGIGASSSNFSPVSTLGLPSYINTAGVKAAPVIELGQYASPNGYSIGTQPWSVSQSAMQGYHFVSTLTHMAGHHELKFGGEWRVNQLNFYDDGPTDGLMTENYYGTSQYMYNPGIAGIGGDAMASFMTGVGSPWDWGEYAISGQMSIQSYRWGGFVQDNWRATNKLTVNVGLRYDLLTPFTERHNRDEWLNLTQSIPIQPTPIDASSWPSVLPMPTGITTPHGGIQFMSPSQREIVDRNYADLGPRFGLAYKLKSNLVFRGGYGLYYNPTLWDSSFGVSYGEGFSSTTGWVTTMNGDGSTPWGRLSNPFPGGLLLPTGSSLGNLTNLGLSVTEPIRSMQKTGPYTQTWSGGLQYQLPGNWMIEANYVGTKGTHLYFNGAGSLQYLGPWVTQEATNPALVNALATYVPNPYYGVINTVGCGICGPTVSAQQLMLPYPQFNGLLDTMPPAANSIYNALQLTVQKRFANGFSLLASYTNSKSIDNASMGAWTGWIGGFTRLVNPNNWKAERSLSEWDIPQVLQFSYIYQLPFGKGKKWGTGWNSVANAFLGGWQTNGMWRFDNGQPIPIYANGTVSPATYGGGIPNITGNLKVNPKSEWFTQGYFANANQVLQMPANYTIGDAPREEPNVRYPGTKNATLSFFKDFTLDRMREGSKLEFRMESFNALNHPQLGCIDTTWQLSTFGDVTCQANISRQVQVALKLYF